MAEGPKIIGSGKCHICTASVQIRENKAGKLYYACNGNHDNKACGSTVTIGKSHSDNIKREMSDGQPKPEPRPEPASDGKSSFLW